ncbi:hypothetical protein HYX19_04805 [Candidatus Woesearchaeota archaeon]|nr:hypothetical protein [Candidatus Woesearchaeota archaeon]
MKAINLSERIREAVARGGSFTYLLTISDMVEEVARLYSVNDKDGMRELFTAYANEKRGNVKPAHETFDLFCTLAEGHISKKPLTGAEVAELVKHVPGPDEHVRKFYRESIKTIGG